MYSHAIKGSTVGHLLARKIFRDFIGIPGALLDVMVALFWVPNYNAYWRDMYVEYADGTRVGMFRGVLGWIGEILGYAIGTPIGIAVGLAVYTVDSVLWNCRIAQRAIYQALDDFALFAPSILFFKDFWLIEVPEDFFDKSYNICGAIVGGLFCAAPYAAAKLVEFFLPFLGNGFSQIIAATAGAVSGFMGATAALFFLYPIAHLIRKAGELYDATREAVRLGVAIIYGKAGVVPAVASFDHCLPDETIHSPEFRRDVEVVNNSTWAQILSGRLGPQAPAREIPGALRPEARKYAQMQWQIMEQIGKNIVDPISHERLGANGVPVLVDNHGHSFNDYRKKPSYQGTSIFSWIAKNHNCPIDRRPLESSQLHANVAYNDILSPNSLCNSR